MFKSAFTHAESVAVIVVVSIPVHYVGGLDWPWAVVMGGAASVVVRWLIHGGTLKHLRRRPATRVR